MGWLAYTTSTVPNIYTFAVFCSVTLPFGRFTTRIYEGHLIMVLSILSTSISASLAQWLEHWSRKPGVESSNLSRGYDFFFLFLTRLRSRLISVAYVTSLGSLRHRSQVHLSFFGCLYITAFASISSNRNWGSFDSEERNFDMKDKVLFHIESHVFAGEEFESKWSLYKFPWLRPICFSEYLRTFAPKTSHTQILLKLWLQVENDKTRLKT